MGNSNLAPPPRDYRVERCVKKFLLTDSTVNTFWRVFKKYDSMDCGFISMHDYQTKILKLPRSSITDGVLKEYGELLYYYVLFTVYQSSYFF